MRALQGYMRAALNTIIEWSKKLRVKFIVNKCSIMEIYRHHKISKLEVRLRGKPIPR